MTLICQKTSKVYLQPCFKKIVSFFFYYELFQPDSLNIIQVCQTHLILWKYSDVVEAASRIRDIHLQGDHNTGKLAELFAHWFIQTSHRLQESSQFGPF